MYDQTYDDLGERLGQSLESAYQNPNGQGSDLLGLIQQASLEQKRRKQAEQLMNLGAQQSLNPQLQSYYMALQRLRSPSAGTANNGNLLGFLAESSGRL